MLPIRKLTDRVSVTGWLNAADFAQVRELGFDKVINFRPDHEVRGQLPSAEVRAAAEAAGLAYTHIPVTKHDLFVDEVVSLAATEFAGGTRVLGYCAGGPRAAIVWAAASARTGSVDTILAALNDAGFDVGFIRDDLEAQADRARWSVKVPSGHALRAKGDADLEAAE